MSTDTRLHLEANVDAAIDLVDALDEVATAYVDPGDLTHDTRRTFDDHGIDPDEHSAEDLFDELLDVAALEIYGKARVDAHGIDLNGVVVVTGTGGPHVEFEVSHTGEVEARGYWSSDRITRRTRADFGDRLADMIGGWDQDRGGR